MREIVPFRRATRLPGAPAYVQGLINLRGTIVTVMDLGARLSPDRAAMRAAPNDGGTGGPGSAAASIILVGYGSRVVGVAVEEVMDVRALAAEDAVGDGSADAVDGPDIDAGTARPIVRGLGHAGEQVVVVLDMHTLIKQVLIS